jgi:hypothetical protein
VGSPQYLLWLAPLVPLLPMQTDGDRRWACGFVVAALLVTLTYPFLWHSVLGKPIPDQPGTWAGPNAVGFVLLIARWAVLALLTVWMGVRLLKDGFQACSSETSNVSHGKVDRYKS